MEKPTTEIDKQAKAAPRTGCLPSLPTALALLAVAGDISTEAVRDAALRVYEPSDLDCIPLSAAEVTALDINKETPRFDFPHDGKEYLQMLSPTGVMLYYAGEWMGHPVPYDLLDATAEKHGLPPISASFFFGSQPRMSVCEHTKVGSQ